MSDTTDVMLDAVVNPVARRSLQAYVYSELKRCLMMGKIRPGEELKVRDLAKMFGTSVQPVREAILQLITEKALEPAANASARVPIFDYDRLIDLRNVRLIVEGMAAELAATRATSADIDRLEKIVAEEIAADDAHRVEASVQRNRDFHFGLYQLSGSALLPSMIESLWLQVGPNIRDAAEVFDARDGRGGEHHLDVIVALRKADPQAVRQSIENDIHGFFNVLLALRYRDESLRLT